MSANLSANSTNLPLQSYLTLSHVHSKCPAQEHKDEVQNTNPVLIECSTSQLSK